MEDHTLTFDALSTLNDLPGCHLILLPDAPQFTIIAATTAYLQATFTERSSILGKGLFEVFPDNPTLAAATGVKNLSASLHWVLKHKKAHHMEDQRYDVRRPQTGDFEYKVWRPMNKPVLSGSGEIRYIIHTVEDITHQVHLQETGQQTQKALTNTSEALLHQKRLTDTILEASLNGIYVLEAVRDKEGKISDFRYLFANQAIADYLGLHVPQMIGNTVLELIPENKTNGFFGYFCQVLEKGAAARDQSYFTSKNFTGWFDFTIVPLDQDTLVVTTQDITEIKKVQLQWVQVVQELQRSNQHLEEFAHAASHDLKEPIRKIHYFTQHLKNQLDSRLGEREMQSFIRIDKATERMATLIDDLLLYSHVSQRPHEKELVDLTEKLQRVLEDLEVDIEEKSARIHLGDLPMILGYRRQLQQLFQNLVSNALKYSQEGVVPQISITAERTEMEGKPYHVISVADNGIGFEQEHSEKIFHMFTRLHGRGEYSGTGVGLSIAQKVAENHGGFIRATGEPSKGATFRVYLPA